MDQLQVFEIRGQRVLTTDQLAECYGADKKIIQNNFAYNRKRYVEGKHFISLEKDDLKAFKGCHEIHGNLKYAHILYLWTEKGALLHAKSLNTDKAWEVYDYLVDFYFRVKEESEPKKEEIVPTTNTSEPYKGKESVPYMEDPIFIFKNLLFLSDEQKIMLKTKDIQGYYSRLHGDRIAIGRNLEFERVVYETAYELSHYFVYYDNGNLISSSFEKDYNEQAERVANMIIQIFNVVCRNRMNRNENPINEIEEELRNNSELLDFMKWARTLQPKQIKAATVMLQTMK